MSAASQARSISLEEWLDYFDRKGRICRTHPPRAGIPGLLDDAPSPNGLARGGLGGGSVHRSLSSELLGIYQECFEPHGDAAATGGHDSEMGPASPSAPEPGATLRPLQRSLSSELLSIYSHDFGQEGRRLERPAPACHMASGGGDASAGSGSNGGRPELQHLPPRAHDDAREEEAGRAASSPLSRDERKRRSAWLLDSLR